MQLIPKLSSLSSLIRKHLKCGSTCGKFIIKQTRPGNTTSTIRNLFKNITIGFLLFWHEKDTMVLDTVSTALRPEALKLQEESHINQFLMNLRPEFESVRAALMNRETSPDLDTCSGGPSRGT